MTKIVVGEKWRQMMEVLNEKQRRYYAALEAKMLGYGGVSLLHRETGIARETIYQGIREIESGNTLEGERVRRVGGGRKTVTTHDPRVAEDLEDIAEPKGDPEAVLRWTTKSFANLKETLIHRGHHISRTSVRNLLKKLGFSLQADKKTIEGETHDPDRNAQFAHINDATKQFLAKAVPVLSIDCKKKELIGNFKNHGREWRKKKTGEKVNVYDFLSVAKGKAIPYGIYEVNTNKGFVNVGSDHDTAEFAVNSLREWWKRIDSKRYTKTKEVYLTSDSGGSNGARVRLWKVSLQQLSNETGLIIHVSHLPPGTSKWNKIEHKLFAFISMNWRAQPLVSMEVIIKLIGGTKTRSGLTVEVVEDRNMYQTKKKVSDEAFATINIMRDTFRGDWNYTIYPNV